jgi:hypothetical protein
VTTPVILLRVKSEVVTPTAITGVTMTTEISTRYSVTAACSRNSEMKARQSLKIREFENALIKAGHTTLDQQARVLGLSRATTWTLLKGAHKSSGLSATIINRMLEAPYLPSLVQAKIIEYVQEKIAGLYGHNKTQGCRFAARLRHGLPARSSATRR